MAQFQAGDLTGVRHGRVTGVRDTGRRHIDGSHIWVCRCDCGGEEFERPASRFKRSISCGCAMLGNAGQFSPHEWTDRTVNDCTPLRPTAERDPSCGYVVWEIRCELCGEEFTRPASALARGSLSHNCRAWWLKHRAHKHRGRPLLPNNASHVNAIYSGIRGGARARGLEFRLSKGEVRTIVSAACAYCGVLPTARTRTNLAGTFAGNGIDRVDSSLGYTPENCVPCCRPCNFAKGTRTLAEFRAWVKRVHDHLGL